MTSLRHCPHPGCKGRLTPDGYCLTTRWRVDARTQLHVTAAGPGAPRTPPVPDPPEPAAAAQPPEPPELPDVHVELPGEDEEDADPARLPAIALGDRAADRAGEGWALDALGLFPGQLLDGQYQLVGMLGYGGMGRVYLARDTKVNEREVAIKFLKDRPQADSGQAQVWQSMLREERRELVELNHEDIIRVHNYGHHPGSGDFLVLQYVDGLNLDQVRRLAAADPARFGQARFHEFVLAYGVRALSALGYLHRHGKVYGDLKPLNLMHDGTSVKFVDIGSVRRRGAQGPTTDEYVAPDVEHDGTDVQDDLYSLGESLRVLSGLGEREDAAGRVRHGTPLPRLAGLAALGTLKTVADPRSAAGRAAAAATTPVPGGLGLVSLARVLHRATRRRRRDRFADTREMELQLRGVLRELRSLRTGRETFEPSPLFHPSPFALAGELGAPPPVSYWARDDDAPRDDAPGQPDPYAPPAPDPYAAPTPAQAAQQLPAPRPDPYDARYKDIHRLTDDDPRALLQRVASLAGSPEVHLLRCRLELQVALQSPKTAVVAERTQRAEDELARAEAAIHQRWAATGTGSSGPGTADGPPGRAREAIGGGPADGTGHEGAEAEGPPRDWRVGWHRGLLALAHGQVAAARDRFDEVYADIPGEYAPKLALGYCYEYLGDPGTARIFYEAVRLRNPSLGGAAFGTARTLLHQGDADARDEAVEALRAVPQHSPHLTAARTAATRIRVHHAVDATGLKEVLQRRDGRLARLFYAHGLTDKQARLRMGAEVWERAFTLLTRGRLTPEELARLHRDADERLRFPADEEQLRRDLSWFYQNLAQQAARPADGSLPGTEPGDRAPLGGLAERLLDRAYAVRPLDHRHNRDIPWLGKRIWKWLLTHPTTWTPAGEPTATAARAASPGPEEGTAPGTGAGGPSAGTAPRNPEASRQGAWPAQAPAERGSAHAARTGGPSSEQAPEDEAPPGKTPADRTPADEAPPRKAPADRTPADETPPGKTPTDRTPADETPPRKTPAENASPGEGPPGKTPAEKTPAEKAPPEEASPKRAAPPEEAKPGRAAGRPPRWRAGAADRLVENPTIPLAPPHPRTPVAPPRPPRAADPNPPDPAHPDHPSHPGPAPNHPGPDHPSHPGTLLNPPDPANPAKGAKHPT